MPTADPEDMKNLAYSCVRGVVGYSQIFSKQTLHPDDPPAEALRHEKSLKRVRELCEEVDAELNELFK